MQAQPSSFLPGSQAISLLTTLLRDVNAKLRDVNAKKNLINEQSIPQANLKELFSKLLSESEKTLKSCNEINATILHGTRLKDLVNKITELVSDHVGLFQTIDDANKTSDYQQFYMGCHLIFRTGLEILGNKMINYYHDVFQFPSAESASSAN